MEEMIAGKKISNLRYADDITLGCCQRGGK